MTDTAVSRPQRARRSAPVETVAAAPQVTPELQVAEAATVSNGNGHDAPAARPVRVRQPFGSRRQRLDNAPIPGFQCRWVNDKPGRVDDAKKGGWEHVTDSEGRPVKTVVGVAEGGGPLVGYRMKILREWYEEDQALKEAPRAELDAQMRRGDKNAGLHASDNPPGFTPVQRAAAEMNADGRQSAKHWKDEPPTKG